MTNSSANLLDVLDVSRSFQDEGRAIEVLRSVTVSLEQRDSLAIIGPSGCGKTTLMLMIAGLLLPDRGRIEIKGSAVRSPRKETALVLQDYGLFPWKTVRQNILLGAGIRKVKVSAQTLADLEKDLGIPGLGRQYPQQLSGGQRQRVALARALLLEPELLILDEPFAALDAMTRERLQTALLELFARRPFSFIIVTHSIEEAATLGRRVLVLGGSPAGVIDILDNPTFGRPDQRLQPGFFDTCVALRHTLGDAS